jgi:hypothetical protein
MSQIMGVLLVLFILGLFTLPVIIIPIVMVKDRQKRTGEASNLQRNQRQAVLSELEKKGFNVDKSVYIEVPLYGFDFRREWIPGVGCTLYVDDTKKKWTIAQFGTTIPKIYKFEDFTGFDVEINGKNAGNTQNNAIVGYIFGGLIGAACGAAFTKRYGTIKTMTIKIKVKDLQNPIITVPVITAPMNGFKETDKGLEFIMTFASNMEQTFGYINDSKLNAANT